MQNSPKVKLKRPNYIVPYLASFHEKRKDAKEAVLLHKEELIELRSGRYYLSTRFRDSYFIKPLSSEFSITILDVQFVLEKQFKQGVLYEEIREDREIDGSSGTLSAFALIVVCDQGEFYPSIFEFKGVNLQVFDFFSPEKEDCWVIFKERGRGNKLKTSTSYETDKDLSVDLSKDLSQDMNVDFEKYRESRKRFSLLLKARNRRFEEQNKLFLSR